MDNQITTALISGLVALVVASLGGALSWTQIKRERKKWLVDVKVAWALELHKTRLASYPNILGAIAPLSTGSARKADPEVARAVAEALNGWFYSAGGLCADATTRGAVLGLRESCQSWAQEGKRPADLYTWRNLAVAFLRRDLDVTGLESYDFATGSTMLEKLQEELASSERYKKLKERGSQTG